LPLTKLDSNAALIVIDLQKGIVGIPTVHPAGRAAQLARAFRERSLPVVLVIEFLEWTGSDHLRIYRRRTSPVGVKG